jgi:Tfp pilus assembly protein PilV
MKNRAGFTLVELLVAVLLVDIGLLALVAGSATVVRRHNELRLHALAANAASNRIQRLVAGGCRQGSGTAVIAPGVVEAWEVTPRGNGTRELRDSVAYTQAGSPRAVVLHMRVAC